MRIRLATKVSAVLAAAAAATVVSSIAGMISAWETNRLLGEVARDYLPSVRAAEELETAVLGEKGAVGSYILDSGNRRWIEDLDRKQKDYEEWLAEARRTSHSAEEQQILAELKDVYHRYSVQRDRTLALYDAGKVDEAKRLLFDTVEGLNDRAYDLCEQFIDANTRYVEATDQRVQRYVWWATTAVGASVVVTLCLGSALLWLFFYGILRPLRQMAADAGSAVGRPCGGTRDASQDELDAVALHLRSLMSDMADTRSLLEQSRRRLQIAEKLETVGRLAATVAHEIRNPLTAIKMWLFALRKAVRGDPDLEEKVAVVSEEINRLEAIVRNFLEFSCPPGLKLRPLGIGEVLDKTAALFRQRAEECKLQLVCRVADGLPPVMADGEQLKQVLVNLVNNAFDAMAEGGEISLAATLGREVDGRPMVVVRVRDTGHGMSDEVCQRIFEPFYSTKEGGTGLGLCIAAGIMARHEGRLVLESSSRCGTVFDVWIPAVREES